MPNEHFLNKKLEERKAKNSLRKLVQVKGMVDFSSNDYLGIMTNKLLQPFISGDENHGSGGARTLTGNYPLIEEVEKLIAEFHDAEAGLIFNSGYCANLGLLSCVPQKGDTILYDYLSHASLRDGIRLSHAEAFSFIHNDPEDLEIRLKKARGNIFVVTESVFSMDGDIAPLDDIVNICEKYGANVIVDEAHATGVIGKKGEGLVQHLGLQQRIFARIHTFGKALGSHGAIVLGSTKLKSYLLNFARSFVFTTALPEVAIQAIKASYSIFPFLTEERKHLQSLIQQFKQAEIPYEKLPSSTPICAVLVPGNDLVKKIALQIQQNNIDVRPILYPTVPHTKERLRINLHAFNTLPQLSLLIGILQQCKVLS
jgi:8-amino-7-oxononanoate synthase